MTSSIRPSGAAATSEPIMVKKEAYADVILRRMSEQRTSLRTLSRRCGIGKSRLGNLLHRDPARRVSPNLAEFLAMLDALGLSMFEAVIRAEAVDPAIADASRFTSTIAMLSRLFRHLPSGIIAALGELDDAEIIELRPDWAAGLERVVVKRVVQEINATCARRAALFENSY